MSLPIRGSLLAASLLLALSACSKKTDEASDVLAYVSADTPYVIANRVPTPRAVAHAWMSMYGDSIESMYEDMAKDEGMQKLPGEFGVWLRALLPEVGKLASAGGLESMGVNPEGRYAVYGHGLLPVYRIELAEAARFAEVIARVEQRAGKTLGKRSVGGVELWQVAGDKAELLLGPVGGYLVVSAGPAGQSDAQWRSQLGLDLPKQSLLASKALETLDRERGFSGHMSGYVDVRALVQRLTGRNQADAEVLRAFGIELPTFEAHCLKEYDAIAAHFPRISAGTTRFDAKTMRVVSVLETDRELAASLKTLAAPIPGHDDQERVMFRLAMSINLGEAVRFAGRMVDAINAEPYTCESLEGLNRSALEAKQGLANPALAMAGSVSAAHLGLRQLELEDSKMPSTLSGFLALGSSSPMMLWGIAQQGVPALSKIMLSADGKPVALPADAFPTPFPLALKALMTDRSFAVATSDIRDAAFTAVSTVPAQSDGTMLRYGVSGELFKLMAENIPAVPGDTREAREAERGRAMIAAMGQSIDGMDVRILVSERGVEVVQEMSLR